MDVDAIKRDHWTDEYTHDHDENLDTEEDDNVCFLGSRRQREKEKGKEIVSRAECSAIGRQGAPTKVQAKETEAKGNGGSHPRRSPRLFVGAQAISTEILRPKTTNMCEKLWRARNLR